MKKCPPNVIYAGALMIRARHGVKSIEDAAKVKVPYGSVSAFTDAYQAIRVAIGDLANPEVGILEMEFGPGLCHFKDAKACAEKGDCDGAYAHILCAHDAFRQVLDKHGIANPTNDDIAKIIALGNWR